MMIRKLITKIMNRLSVEVHPDAEWKKWNRVSGA